MDRERAGELLARERARVERSLAELEPEVLGQEEGGTGQHPADSGSDLFEREKDAGMCEDLRAELAAIERAEQRLADGTYGRSIDSGEPIPDERLEAVPWAERTIAEQQRHERGGR